MRARGSHRCRRRSNRRSTCAAPDVPPPHVEATPAARAGGGARDVTRAIELELEGRWDAIRLMERLVPFRSFVVQTTPTRWTVYARPPSAAAEAELRQVLDELFRERGLEPPA